MYCRVVELLHRTYMCVRTRARLSRLGGISRNRAVHRSNITEGIAHNTTDRAEAERSSVARGAVMGAEIFVCSAFVRELYSTALAPREKGLPARLHLSDCRSRMRPTPSKPCALSPPPPHQPRHICSTPSTLVARWPPRHGCAVPATWRACLAASARCWRSCGARGWDG